MSERGEKEVWIQPVSKWHCYIRFGKNANLATVNHPADSELAEAVREAAQAWVDANCANRNVLQDNKGEVK